MAIRHEGLIAPLITPVDGQGRVSERSVGRLIESIRPFVTAVMPALSSGEGWMLSEAQWRDVVGAATFHARPLPVVAGALGKGTREVIARGEMAIDLGVDAIAVAAPFGGRASQGEIVEHYRTIGEILPVPVFVYNAPALTGNGIELETMLEICRLPGVAGVKESSGSAEYTNRLAAAVPKVPVFQGWEHLLLQSVGVAGGVLPLANLEPALCAALVERPSPELQARVDALCERHGLLADGWYASLKDELHRRGVIESAAVIEKAVGKGVHA